MADIKGDNTKKPDDCKVGRGGGSGSCANLKEVGGGMDSERYRCEVCGEAYTLYYEDMA